MGILSTLDEKILQIYEKTNHYCYKKFGTDKYDLAQKCDTASSITMAGAGSYYVIYGFNHGLYAHMIIGGTLSALGFLKFSLSKKSNSFEKSRELSIIERTGAIIKPTKNPSRVWWMIYAAGLLSWGLHDLVNKGKDEYAINLGLICLGFSTSMHESASYFRDTTMFPPKKKKAPWYKRAYQSLTSLVKKQAPVAVEANRCESLEQKSLEQIIS